MTHNDIFEQPVPPVFLVSSEAPGCGASTLCGQIEVQMQRRGFDTVLISVGQLVREMLEARNEFELQERLDQVADPKDFDPEIYGNLPTDACVIVDGKLATTAGPQFISDRPIVAIDLTAPALVSAGRIVAREGGHISDPGYPERLLDNYLAVARRSEHDVGMRDVISSEQIRHTPQVSITLPTESYAPQELIGRVFNGVNHESVEAEAWEIEALKTAYLRLHELSYRSRSEMRPEDRIHFEHHMEAISYGIDRLGITMNQKGVAAIRTDLKSAITDCWYGLMMKKIPRFKTVDKDGVEALELDTTSPAWSPEFYKIAEGWPTIKGYLKGKTALDPYAGSGEMMNLLVARGVVSGAIFSDILYSPDERGVCYEPRLNTEAGRLLFDGLPSWYKPDLSPILGYIAADSRRLPLRDNSVEYVFGDPPYGKNHMGPGIGTMLGSIDELCRVASEGVIMLVPVSWLEDIRAAGITAEQLTKDLSRGQSNYPVCYIHINSKEGDQEA
jgi:cytidylate kinase